MKRKCQSTTSDEGGILPPLALLDYPSVFLSNKVARLLRQRALFQEQFRGILSF